VRESGSLAARSQSPPTKCRDLSAAPKPDRRRALGLLASCGDGCTEAMMLAHGFSIEQIVELVRAGLATATAERIAMGRDHRGAESGGAACPSSQGRLTKHPLTVD
jgi:hypothetical protein